MFTIFGVFLFLIVLIIVGSIYWYRTIPKNLPPGPIGLPFIGSSIEYWDATKQHLILQENVKKYGPIFKLYIANKLVIVLGNYETIQEAIVKQADIFSGRPQLQSFLPERVKDLGVIMSEGEFWKEQRRFALSTLRDFGVGRPIIEPRIKEEIEYLNNRISDYATTKTSFDPQRLVTCAVSNIISQLLFGRRFSYEDEEFVRQFMGLSKRTSADGVSFLSPFILSDYAATLLAPLPLVRQMKAESEDFLNFVELQMKKTMDTFEPDTEANNFIHAFLKATSSSSYTNSYFNTEQLLAVSSDLFTAGTETTSTTTRFAILFLAHHPNVQEKLYQQIKHEVGIVTLPSYSDRPKLPYAEAVVMETQRLADLVPLGVFRRALQPTKLMGYDIPPNAMVLPLLTNVLHNPDIYPEPLKFKPERFLDESGKVIRDPKLIPFQCGKRVCLGEPLARMELFLLLVGLISRFRFYFPNDKPLPTMEPIIGFTTSPAPYEVLVELRND